MSTRLQGVMCQKSVFDRISFVAPSVGGRSEEPAGYDMEAVQSSDIIIILRTERCHSLEDSVLLSRRYPNPNSHPPH